MARVAPEKRVPSMPANQSDGRLVGGFMQEDRRFYVYVHRRKTDGSVFYVGKGVRDRWLATWGRNPHWNNVVRKHGFNSHIVARFSNEVCAFSLERALIGYYGIKNLTNMTLGGEGVSGHKPTGCQRILMSLRRLGKKNTPEHIAAVVAHHTGSKRSRETCERISRRALSRLKDPRMHWHTTELVSTWWHEDGEIRNATHIEMAQEFGLSIDALKKVEIGKSFAFKGWKVAGVRNYGNEYLSRGGRMDNQIYIWHKRGCISVIGTRNDFILATNESRRAAEAAIRRGADKGRGTWYARKL